MFTVFMVICLVISIIVNIAYSFAAKAKEHYTVLVYLIMNLLGALVGYGLVLEHGRTVTGLACVIANSICVVSHLRRLLSENSKNKTEEN